MKPSHSMLNEQLSVEDNEAWLNILGQVDYPAEGDPYDAERQQDFDVPDERHEYRDSLRDSHE